MGLLPNDIAQVRTLRPTYVRSYLYGLREAIEKRRAVSWQPVLDLCTWVVEQPAGSEEHDLFGEEQGWGSTRSPFADLLDVALAKTPPIPLVHRDQVWRIIRILAQDPDPTPALEATYADDRDPASLAINTIRGKALEAVVAYALWVRAQTPEPRDFSGMPEVRTILDEHLQHDPSLAIRSVYGRFFPWLVLLDHQWAADHVTTIFGDERGRAAWETYLTMCAAYDDTVALLPEYYERAVAALQPDRAAEPRRGKPNPDEHLGEHLITMYWRGHRSLADPLITGFFGRAPAPVRAHAITFLGRSLYATKEPISAAIRERLLALWTARRQSAETALDEHRGELAAFGWWFAAGQHFAPAWALSELREVLQRVHTVELDHAVLERLATLASSYPALAVACVRAFIEGERQYWTLLGAEKHVRTILRAALQDASARQDAAALIHALGVLGYTKYRDLLQPAP